MLTFALLATLEWLHQRINASIHQFITVVTEESFMRTTLDIDDDLLAAAKELARRQGGTTGQVVSRLLRHSLAGVDAVAARTLPRRGSRRVAGFEPFAAKSGVVATNEQVDALRDAEGV
jgi:Arc/MetJ family transcription regulator